MGQEEKTSVELETPLGKGKIEGSHVNTFFTILGAMLAAVLIYMIWEHKQHTEAASQTFSEILRSSLKEVNQTSKELLQVQREQLCILSLPPEKREQEFRDGSWCKRVTR